MAPKMLAEWFWADRWMGSSAFLLPMEARGLYREMLTQAWRRNAALPNDHGQIQRATGCTAAEWRRSWPKIERFWRVDGDCLVPVEALGYCRPLPGQTQHRPHIPLATRRAVLKRDGNACIACGSPERLTLDHAVPVAAGGLDTFDNLQAMCWDCNREKAAH